MHKYICEHCKHTVEFPKGKNGGSEAGKMYQDCAACNTKVGMRKVCKFDSVSIFRCGGKDSLSKWEEIFHRPRSN
ncbi:MAG: hypothetical protein KAJ19_29010 [Gammaproteobacteria bacterium]|nr:hypothetical protein [Gammaproteobacteria bacterium]